MLESRKCVSLTVTTEEQGGTVTNYWSVLIICKQVTPSAPLNITRFIELWGGWKNCIWSWGNGGSMDRALFMQALGVEFGSPDLHKVECHRSLNPGLPWPEGGVEIQILDVQGPARLTNIANQQRVCFKQGTDIRDGPWTISPLYACHYTAVHTQPHLDTRGGGREGKRDSKKKKILRNLSVES